MDSILTSIKKLLGIAEEYTIFDADIIMHINSTFMVLQQLGVGPPEGFYIEDTQAYWEDFIPDLERLRAVRTYMGLKVRLLFDPPSSTAVLGAYESMIKEYEWRLNVASES